MPVQNQWWVGEMSSVHSSIHYTNKYSHLKMYNLDPEISPTSSLIWSRTSLRGNVTSQSSTLQPGMRNTNMFLLRLVVAFSECHSSFPWGAAGFRCSAAPTHQGNIKSLQASRFPTTRTEDLPLPGILNFILICFQSLHRVYVFIYISRTLISAL